MGHLGLAPSYAALCAVQAAVVAAPSRRASSGRFVLVGLLVPAALLGAGVATLDLASWGPRALALLATFGTPFLAAAGGLLSGRSSWWLEPPAALALWLVAWQAHGLLRDAAGVALIGGACLTVAAAATLVAPAGSIELGLVALAALDVVLVWGTKQAQTATTALHAVTPPVAAGTPLPSLQDATFGSALMGWLDVLAPALLGILVARRSKLAAAAATGLAAGLWGLLLLATPEVAATVPVLAGLLVARATRRRD